jgi:hypothetical protein
VVYAFHVEPVAGDAGIRGEGQMFDGGKRTRRCSI